MPSSLDHLRSLSARERAIVLDSEDEQLRHEPEVPTRNRKPMRPNPLAPWELRLGDLRVFYDLRPAADEETESEVVILAVGRKVGNQFWIGGEEHEL